MSSSSSDLKKVSYSKDEQYISWINDSISGSYTLKKILSLKSVNGSVKAQIGVAPSDAKTRELVTTSQNGSVNVAFTTPLNLSTYKLTSTHGSTNGSVTVSYPNEWQGTIEAKSWTGSCNITGDDVTILRSERNWLGRLSVIAVKGKDVEAHDPSYHKIDIYSTNGGIRLNFESDDQLVMEQHPKEVEAVQSVTTDGMRHETETEAVSASETQVADGGRVYDRPSTPPPAYEDLGVGQDMRPVATSSKKAL